MVQQIVHGIRSQTVHAKSKLAYKAARGRPRGCLLCINVTEVACAAVATSSGAKATHPSGLLLPPLLLLLLVPPLLLH